MYETELAYADNIFENSDFADTFVVEDAEYLPEFDRVHYFDETGQVLVVDFETGDVYFIGEENGE